MRSCPTTDACCRLPSISDPSGGRPPGSPPDLLVPMVSILLLLSSSPSLSDSFKVPLAAAQLQLLITTGNNLLPLRNLKSAKGTHISKTFLHCMTIFITTQTSERKGSTVCKQVVFSSLHVSHLFIFTLYILNFSC